MMPTMNLLLLSIILSTTLTTDVDINLNCDRYVNDLEILDSFPYDPIQYNREYSSAKITHATVDDNNRVTFLQIANQDFIPSDIFCFEHLVELRIINTTSFDIQSLPKSLVSLRISKIKMTYLSSDINRLVNLQSLEITKTDLQYVSEFTAGLSQLRFLILASNKLQELPSSIVRLKNLIQLDVSENPTLHSLAAINHHPTLKILSASSCSIDEIPKGLFKLVDLILNDNILSSLNNIETLGRSTSQRKSFFFQNNTIKTISTEIQHIRNPFIINLNFNQIYMIPREMCKLKTLKRLYIRKNPFSRREWSFLEKRLYKCLPNLKIL